MPDLSLPSGLPVPRLPQEDEDILWIVLTFLTHPGSGLFVKRGSLETSSPYSESISRLPGTAFSSEGLYRIPTKKGGWSAGSVLPLPLLFRALFSSHTNSPYAHTPSLLEVISRPAQNPPSWQKGTFNPPPILASRLCRSIFWIFASFPSSGPSVTIVTPFRMTPLDMET